MYLLFYLSCFCAVLSLKLTNAWDLAVSTGGQIELYHRNGTHTSTINHLFTELTALTYDPVRSSFFFADSKHENHTIFGFHLSDNRNVENIVRRTVNDDELIQGLAVDPVADTLFWTDNRYGKSGRVMFTSLAPGQYNSAMSQGKPLFKMEYEIPRGIAVDSCRGMVYWTNVNTSRPTIERATIEGDNRTVIVSTDLFRPIGLTIDIRSKRIFWCDDREGIHYRIESADLNGGNRQIVHVGTDHQPFGLAVGHGFIYWTDRTVRALWQKPSNPEDIHSEAVKVIQFGAVPPTSVVVNLDIVRLIEGMDECKPLNKTIHKTIEMLKTQSLMSDQAAASADIDTLFCLRDNRFRSIGGVKQDELCMCPKDFRGGHCEASVCRNYCLNGDCEVDGNGLPRCKRCHKGYKGDRCHENMCDNFCLNNGKCAIDSNIKAICTCIDGWTGERCQFVAETKKTSHEISVSNNSQQKTDDSQDANRSNKKLGSLSNDSSDRLNISVKIYNGIASEMNNNDSGNNQVENDDDPITRLNILNLFNQTDTDDMSSDEFTDIHSLRQDNGACDCLDWQSAPLIAIYSCSIFFLLTTFLLATIHIRRPRIKKRHVVIKNFNPLRRRANPATCEISIETCCNMELCETPCYQSGSLQSNVKESSAKDEKKNLLMNMELNKDGNNDNNRCVYPDYDFHK